MKNALRKKYLALRKSKSSEELLKSSEKIIDNLCSVSEFQRAQTIMVYVSFRGEVDTHALIKKLLKQKKRVCVPLCDESDLSMTAREITEFSDLHSGCYGILEPKDCSSVVEKDDIDFIIVPGCAFSEDGHRIGYGKGYYDKFLSGARGISCGLSYDFSIADDIGAEKTDVPLNMIITQSRIIKP